jgi:hypothetical protein
MAVAHENGQCRILGLRLHFAYAPGMELGHLRPFVAVAEAGKKSPVSSRPGQQRALREGVIAGVFAGDRKQIQNCR